MISNSFVFIEPNGTEWHLHKKFGSLIKINNSEIETQYYISNPPAHGTMEHLEFVRVCDYAVSIGLLRPIKMYAYAD